MGGTRVPRLQPSDGSRLPVAAENQERPVTDVPLDTIADAVDALCNPMDVREPYETWHGNNRRTNWHRYRAPSLLARLASALRRFAHSWVKAQAHNAFL
jgi:hypothetical protein